MELTDTSSNVNRPSNNRRQVLMPRHNATDTQAVDVQTPEPLHELMSPEVNVQRIMWTGTIWFVGAIGAVGIALGFLLSSGWRPDVLGTGLESLWWVAFFIVVLSIGLIGWSGCPILEVSVPVADKNKTRTMQLGTALFIVGSAAAMFAVLLGPAS